MKEPDRKKRNDTRFLELFPTFRGCLEKVIVALESKEIRPRIQDAWRSPADQEKAFRSGHSKLLFGFHNVTASNGTPEALAVDLLDDDSPLSPSKNYLLQLAAAAEAAGGRNPPAPASSASVSPHRSTPVSPTSTRRRASDTCIEGDTDG